MAQNGIALCMHANHNLTFYRSYRRKDQFLRCMVFSILCLKCFKRLFYSEFGKIVNLLVFPHGQFLSKLLGHSPHLPLSWQTSSHL